MKTVNLQVQALDEIEDFELVEIVDNVQAAEQGCLSCS
jgi:hypothetical protein